MLRGVNRRVIEVNECRSVFFERAIFFVRADAPECSEQELRDEADSLLKDIDSPVVRQSSKKQPISRRVLWLMVWLSSGLSAVLATLSFIK